MHRTATGVTPGADLRCGLPRGRQEVVCRRRRHQRQGTRCVARVPANAGDIALLAGELVVQVLAALGI
jgi:hypothetical protein